MTQHAMPPSPVYDPQPPMPGRVVLWPRILGVLSMVGGGANILNGLLALASLTLYFDVNWLAEMLELVGPHLIQGGLGILLLVAGWALYRQRLTAAWLHLLWSALVILALMGLLLLGLWRTGRIGVLRGPFWLTAAQLLMGMIYPVFVAIWFCRRRSWRDLRASTASGRLIVRNVDGTYRQL